MKNGCKYIFFSYNIHVIGGSQMYLEGKVEFLKNLGYSVYIFFPGNNYGKCRIKDLDEFVYSGGLKQLSSSPARITKILRENVIDRMINAIGFSEEDRNKIIIESHGDILALWGEFLAERIGAKHICLLTNERIHGKGKYYSNYIKYFDAKHQRKELACIKDSLVVKLFEGYKHISPDEQYIFNAGNKGAVRDIEDDRLSKIYKKDFSICYIGNTSKGYVPLIIDDIIVFANRYRDKKINFIIVGESQPIEYKLKEIDLHIDNLTCIRMGDMVPIPRKLFSLIDVTIAGAGSARCSFNENIPTIIADANDYKSNGILGYDTMNTLFSDSKKRKRSYLNDMERVLIRKSIEVKSLSISDRKLSLSEKYQDQMEFVRLSQPIPRYFTQTIMNSEKIDYLLNIKLCLKIFLGFLTNFHKKLHHLVIKRNTLI